MSRRHTIGPYVGRTASAAQTPLRQSFRPNNRPSIASATFEATGKLLDDDKDTGKAATA